VDLRGDLTGLEGGGLEGGCAALVGNNNGPVHFQAILPKQIECNQQRNPQQKRLLRETIRTLSTPVYPPNWIGLTWDEVRMIDAPGHFV
jgi:hypothetical protein